MSPGVPGYKPAAPLGLRRPEPADRWLAVGFGLQPGRIALPTSYRRSTARLRLVVWRLFSVPEGRHVCSSRDPCDCSQAPSGRHGNAREKPRPLLRSSACLLVFRATNLPPRWGFGGPSLRTADLQSALGAGSGSRHGLSTGPTQSRSAVSGSGPAPRFAPSGLLATLRQHSATRSLLDQSRAISVLSCQ